MKKIFLNWKQNGSFNDIINFKNKLIQSEGVVLFTPSPYLYFASSNKFEVGSQNVSAFGNGAFTGEVGALMLKECGVRYCLVGHSERRTIFNEKEPELSSKIKLLKQVGITPVLCVGENLEERKSGKIFSKIQKQMEIFESGVLVAYEPVWSIGTGITAKEEEIAEVSSFMHQNYKIDVIYGGSVSSSNSKSILNIPHISGVLIGGASLKVDEVNKILNDNSRN